MEATKETMDTNEPVESTPAKIPYDSLNTPKSTRSSFVQKLGTIDSDDDV